MKILIKETNEVESLSLIDEETAYDWLHEFVGMYDGFSTNPEKGFVKEVGETGWFTGRYITTQANYDLWCNGVEGLKAIKSRIEKLKEEVGADIGNAISNEILNEMAHRVTNIEQFVDVYNEGLDRAFGKDAGR